MKAHQGDRIILAASHLDEPTRDGKVLEVRGDDGAPPYLIRWSDGHTGLLFPGPGAVLRVGPPTEEVAGGAHAGAPSSHDIPAAATIAAPGHVRDWQVRVSIFESDDDTSARVVLLSDAPTHLTARGQSHRGSKDLSVPEIGDEVAVSRALRHLADQLLEAASQDIEAVTGEGAYIRPA